MDVGFWKIPVTRPAVISPILKVYSSFVAMVNMLTRPYFLFTR
jgi:hypothetical protein